jgi:hypothetical protein
MHKPDKETTVCPWTTTINGIWTYTAQFELQYVYDLIKINLIGWN